ncbi:MAG: hypothetical protein N2446_01250 [Elusimicrobiales bacterium]|nr:hypothetical protein [Elusimicrobiales bacterium]
MKILYILIMVLFTITPVFCEETINNNFSENTCREIIKLFNESLNKSTSEAEVYHSMAGCYESLNNIPMSALMYLKAKELGKTEAGKMIIELFNTGDAENTTEDEIKILNNMIQFINLIEKEGIKTIKLSDFLTDSIWDIRKISEKVFLEIGKAINMEYDFNNELNWRKERIPLISLTSVRGAIQMYYAENEGRYPKNLNELIPKYLSKIKQIYIKNHKKTSKVTIYNSSITKKDEKTGEIKIDYSKLKDTGGYGYIYDEKSPWHGYVFIDCTHKNSKGVIWASY